MLVLERLALERWQVNTSTEFKTISIHRKGLRCLPPLEEWVSRPISFSTAGIFRINFVCPHCEYQHTRPSLPVAILSQLGNLHRREQQCGLQWAVNANHLQYECVHEGGRRWRHSKLGHTLPDYRHHRTYSGGLAGTSHSWLLSFSLFCLVALLIFSYLCANMGWILRH